VRAFLASERAAKLRSRIDEFAGVANFELMGRPQAATGVAPLGPLRVGSVAQLAQCSDWNVGTRAERLATIADIRAQVNLRDGAVRTAALSNEAAYRVLQSTCANGFARSFRLYKVYAKAASFAAFANG
jgi:hypothetical protein